ncbi:hypothetical protein [Saccharopolyspora sp. NPDC002376]
MDRGDACTTSRGGSRALSRSHRNLGLVAARRDPHRQLLARRALHGNTDGRAEQPVHEAGRRTGVEEVPQTGHHAVIAEGGDRVAEPSSPGHIAGVALEHADVPGGTPPAAVPAGHGRDGGIGRASRAVVAACGAPAEEIQQAHRLIPLRSSGC